jgi:hypothetical protein
MKKPYLVAAMAASAVALSAGAAAAQGRMSIDQRQAQLDSRIDAGIRSGDLSRSEAMQLRAEFRDLAILESRYRANGLSRWEMTDLDRRFDQLSVRIRAERHDSQNRMARADDWGRWFGGSNWTDTRGRWISIERRRAQLDRRIAQGLRSGQLTSAEAARLRSDLHVLARVEMRYRRNGLSSAEMADLNRRFAVLATKIRFERTDQDRRYGAGYYR